MVRPRRLNRGVVLLTTLLMMAILAAIGWNLSGQQTLLITEHRMAFANDQAIQYALGAESFARQILRDDWIREGEKRDSLLEPWAQSPPPFTIDNGMIELRARDLNGCFNLNALVDGAYGDRPAASDTSQTDLFVQAEVDQVSPGNPSPFANAAGSERGAGEAAGSASNLERLRRLLTQSGLPPDAADAWRDWIDPDDIPSGSGAEDGDYMMSTPPFRAANQLAAHRSEFDLIKGMESVSLAALSESVCVLPTPALKVNVNTATPAVLAALVPEVNADMLAEFAAGPRDFSDIGQFTSQFSEFSNAVDALTVSSEYFEISVRVRVDDSTIEMVSVIHRDLASGQIELVSRDLSRHYLSRSAALVAARPSP
jgi:general secretion pathway protein K